MAGMRGDEHRWDVGTWMGFAGWAHSVSFGTVAAGHDF